MKHLLTREQIIPFNEAAVDRNKSALGLLTKAVISPLSWLAGSIKKGLKKRQMSALTMQWGIEYVNALRATDLKEEVKQEPEVEGNTEEETVPEEIANPGFKITEENKPELIKTLTTESKYFSSLNNLVKGMSSWIVINNTAGYDTLKKALVAIPETEITENLDKILKLIPNNKILDIQSVITTFDEFCNDIKEIDLTAFNTKYTIKDKEVLKKIVTEQLTNYNNINNAYTTAIKFVTDFKDKQTVETSIDLKVGTEYEYTKSNGEKTFVKLVSLDHTMAPGEDKIYFTDDDKQLEPIEDKNIASAIYIGKDNKFSDTVKPLPVVKSKLKTTKQIGESISIGYNKRRMILEADVAATATATPPVPDPAKPTDKTVNKTPKKSYKLPTKVEDLMDQEELTALEAIPDIKTTSFPKINFIRLDAIHYEANFLYQKSVTQTAAKNTKAGTPGVDEDSAMELKKVWDISIKNVNDKFQKVIDIEKVLAKVPIDITKPGTIDEKSKAAITENEKQIDHLKAMGLTDTIPNNYEFSKNKNKAFAFNCSFMGQNNKSKTRTLIISPTTDYIEKIDDKTYFWFKILGGYEYDDKTKKINRVNIFNGYTPNDKITKNFAGKDDAYYMVTRNLQVKMQNQIQYIYIYSNKGSFFYNNQIIPDITTVAEDIKSKYKKDKFDDTIKAIANDSNLFRIKVNQRFLIDDAFITGKKYPGITLDDLTKDAGFAAAKVNHDKFIEIIK